MANNNGNMEDLNEDRNGGRARPGAEHGVARGMVLRNRYQLARVLEVPRQGGRQAGRGNPGGNQNGGMELGEGGRGRQRNAVRMAPPRVALGNGGAPADGQGVAANAAIRHRPQLPVIQVGDSESDDSSDSDSDIDEGRVGASGIRMPIPLGVLVEMENSQSNLDRLVSRDMAADGRISDELAEKVFGNDMLREMILERVIISSSGSVAASDLKSVRLVRKSWLITAAESLRKHSLPMFTLTLHAGNSTNACQYVLTNGTKLLEDFVRSMTSATRLLHFIPPFKLILTPDFFRTENRENLSDCLVSCGGAMVDMELSLPSKSSMVFTFPPFFLPKLHRLCCVQARAQTLHNSENHMIYSTQILLNSTEELKELVFRNLNPSGNWMPKGFEQIALPQTLTKLSLDGPVKDSDLQLLINNPLPNLTNLTLFATGTPVSVQTIYQVLEKFRASLKTLCLDGYRYVGRVRNASVFRFPVMDKLESVTVASPCWEFQGERLRDLGRQLPKMTDLRMLSTRESMFTKWTGDSVYPEVKNLTVSLIETPNNRYFEEVPMTLTLEKMQSLHFAFPNVVCLEVTLCMAQTCGLKYLFMEMVSLQKLAITVKGSRDYFEHTHWDSLLIGVETDVAEKIKAIPNYWMWVNSNDDNNFPSIRRLTALKSLALVEAFNQPACIASNAPLISDLAFQFAFFKMQNLTNVLLRGRFSASAEMRQLWMERKGTEII